MIGLPASRLLAIAMAGMRGRGTLASGLGALVVRGRGGSSLAAPTLALLAIAGLTGCGGTQAGPAVVHVGAIAIEKASVEHWAAAIERGAVVMNVTDPAAQSPKQRAISLLISFAWLRGEAERVAPRPSRAQLAHALAQQGSAASGATEAGQTPADLEAEARAGWEAHALAQLLAAEVKRAARAQVTGVDVARYYHTHIARYRLRERRYYDLLERIPSKSRAAALAKRLGTGKRFAERTSKEKPFRPRSFSGLPGQAVVYRAVFAAKRTGVLVGPLPLQGQWCVFVLRRIVPAHVESLTQMRGAIEAKLLTSARHRVRTKLIASYRRRWLARTSCSPGYVVQKCKQYRGRLEPEAAPFSGY
jgi:hypothetical protein